MTHDEFRMLYELPPELKVEKTKARIREFYSHFGGDVFLSFSGGKDSTVLGHIIRNMPEPYCDIEFVFFDTHNEDESVYDIVKEWGATVVSSPYTPREVVDKVGYPLFNKEIAEMIEAMQKKRAWVNDVSHSRRKKTKEQIERRYMLFVNSPLRISAKCCDESKKKPSKKFTKETGKYPIVATLAVESLLRMQNYLRTGCNSFEGKIKSVPISFWKKSDILWYIAQHDLKIADCYKAKITNYPLLGYKTCTLCGKDQTGCLYCGFGKGMEFAKKVLKARCPDYVKEHQEEFDNLH
jgi:3'-phosphoadenosine 5'-phosphosulfate sulfotransferase (PAPS reductase)/FAD synthetase